MAVAMRCSQPGKILIFTAPTAVTWHLEIARQLRKKYPGVPVQFLSLYSLAIRRLRKEKQDAIYVPDVLKSLSGDEMTEAEYRSFDQRLYGSVGTNINLMLWGDKSLPELGKRAERLAKKYVIALDRLITPETLAVARLHDCFFLWLASAITTAKDGWFFGFNGSAIPPNSTIALRTPLTTWRVPGPGLRQEQVEDLRNGIRLPPAERIDYMVDMTPSRLVPAIREQLSSVWGLWRDSRSGSGEVRLRHVFEIFWVVRARWRARFSRLQNIGYDYRTMAEVENEAAPFGFFPIQFEPEASILNFSPWFRDQWEAIRLASQAMPVGWLLLVKEHPIMIGYRKRSFYRKLCRMPNIRLVSPDLASYGLMQQSQFVVSIAGTACLEAKLLGKASYCFGRPPFSSLLDGADLGQGFCLERFSETISRSENREVDLVQLQRFLESTFRANSCTLSRNGVWQHDDSEENTAKFIDFMEQAMLCAAADSI